MKTKTMANYKRGNVPASKKYNLVLSFLLVKKDKAKKDNTTYYVVLNVW